MRRLAVALVGLLPLAACQTTGMSFVRDTRLSISSPRPRALVQLPVEVRWRATDELLESIRDSDGERYFAVFVDRAPIRGGRDISDLVDRECRRTPGCGDEEWFNDRGVYFTSQERITITDVDDLREDRNREDRDLHRATVVVMQRAEDPVLGTHFDGARDGEGAVSVEFWVDRRRP